MDWYYKAAIAVSLIWATARALGIYGESARDLDLAFLFGFMLTLGGWAAVFMIIDRVAKFLGWKRRIEPAIEPDVGPAAATPVPAAAPAPAPASQPPPAATTTATPRGKARTSRR